MSKINYLREVNNLKDLQTTSIVALSEKEACRHTFGDEPTVEILPNGNLIEGIVISKEEYDELYDKWYQKYVWTIHTHEQEEELEVEFKPLTSYRLIYNDLIILGYSQRSLDNLNRFLQDMRGKQFLVYDINGNVTHLIGPQISMQATYCFTEM